MWRDLPTLDLFVATRSLRPMRDEAKGGEEAAYHESFRAGGIGPFWLTFRLSLEAWFYKKKERIKGVDSTIITCQG